MISAEDFPILKGNTATLKSTSIDNCDGTIKYMTESEIMVVNFDSVKDEYIKDLHLSEAPKSNDALYLNDSTITFIEFKNGCCTGKEHDLGKKIYDSTVIFSDVIGQGISYMRNNVDYILVYNEEKNVATSSIPESPSRLEIGRHFTKKGNDQLILFNLKRFKNYLYKNVFTYTEDEFERNFVAIHTAI